MVQVGKDITWQDSLILENEVSVLNNVLYGDLTGVFLNDAFIDLYHLLALTHTTAGYP